MALFSAALASTVASSALAGAPYVVLTDDGKLETNGFNNSNDFIKGANDLVALYQASGQPIPEIMSVWTTFPLGGSNGGTFFIPITSDVTGIGVESTFGGDGTYDFTSDWGVAGQRSMLLHNNVLKVADAAARHRAPVEGYAEYLFLLELSHNWGPALTIPSPNVNALVGFDFHWSFYMDAGGSPAGGNRWLDNGDGTFTVDVQTPSTLKYSPVDLYIMGLIPPEEVPPFSVLEDVVAPAMPTDPIWSGQIQAHTFPWFDATTPITVAATRRALTIDDVVAANGVRTPAAGTKTSYTLGIVLLTRKDDDDAQVAAARALFDPIASNLAPTFAAATSGKGSLDVITETMDPSETTATTSASSSSSSTSAATTSATTSGAGGGGGQGGEGGGNEVTGSGCSCRAASPARKEDALAWMGALALGAAVVRARRARRG